MRLVDVYPLRDPGPHLGLWSFTAHPRILEAAGSVGPDFVCVDAQHGTDIAQLTPAIFETLARFDVPGMVRVAAADPTPIGRALDLGAVGVMVPMVETVAQAELAVKACRYGPDGVRSYGMQTTRLDPFAAHYRPICAVQIETAKALDNVDGIAAVEGVDWLYIGPADLGLSLGGVPAPDVLSVFDGSHPLAYELSVAFERVVETANALGILPGLHCGSGEAAAQAIAHGFAVACVTADLTEVQTGLAEQLERARR